jgi:hypothetical protein
MPHIRTTAAPLDPASRIPKPPIIKASGEENSEETTIRNVPNAMKIEKNAGEIGCLKRLSDGEGKTENRISTAM